MEKNVNNKTSRKQSARHTARYHCNKLAANLVPLLPPVALLDACCSGGRTDSPTQVAAVIGYDANELESIPQASILGVGCGAPVNFADLQKGETVVYIGSGAGIDVFSSAKRISNEGIVIGIDMTDEMLERARRLSFENTNDNEKKKALGGIWTHDLRSSPPVFTKTRAGITKPSLCQAELLGRASLVAPLSYIIWRRPVSLFCGISNLLIL